MDIIKSPIFEFQIFKFSNFRISYIFHMDNPYRKIYQLFFDLNIYDFTVRIPE